MPVPTRSILTLDFRYTISLAADLRLAFGDRLIQQRKYVQISLVLIFNLYQTDHMLPGIGILYEQ